MFSVLLSLYIKEEPSFLRQSLDSLFSQTVQPTEIVLVKDGPLTEELDSIVSDYERRYPILKVIVLEQNLGLGRALNEGLKHCSFDLVARMDTDDIAKPNRFEKQIIVFQEHPEVDVCGTWIDEFEDDISKISSCRKLPEKYWDICKYAKTRNPLNHVTVMFKKNVVQAAGGYKHFFLFEDYYLWVRMLKNGAIFYNIQESLVYVRTSPTMFKRRGGWKYAMNELRFQRTLLSLGIVSRFRFVKNVLIRFPIRIAPNKVRSWLYQKALRK